MPERTEPCDASVPLVPLVPATAPPRGRSAAEARDALHALPVPFNFDLCGALRRRIDARDAEHLSSLFDEFVCRTVLGADLYDAIDPDLREARRSCGPRSRSGEVRLRAEGPRRGEPDVSRRIESWIRVYAGIRRRWIDAAHRAVGDAGVTPLRVEALAIVRAASLRSRVSAGTRADLDAALGDIGPVLSGFALARRLGMTLDLRRLRVLSTRFDFCVSAALLGEAESWFASAELATPLLCAEARITAARLRGMLDPRAAAERPPGRQAAAGRRPRWRPAAWLGPARPTSQDRVRPRSPP